MANLHEEQSLFDGYLPEFETIPVLPDLTSTPRDQELLRILREERERSLSSYAMKSVATRGRTVEESPCSVRSEFERDIGRVIYSQAFRRLRHKTQVFFNPQNDHICSRIEHVIYVNYVAKTIARALNLNLDLVEAIALSHDLGHAPFGHSGERTLDVCVKKHDKEAFFQHELHGLRVADLLMRRSKADSRGMNLTFEVRDGIASHCGETYSEFKLKPNRSKEMSSILQKSDSRPMPATLEGCVVRLVDKIAYVGRDIEDAARAGIMDFDEIPPAISTALGSTNSQIIHTLVTDVIHHSLNSDAIVLSDEAGQAMEALLRENVKRIYQSPKVKSYEARVKLTVEGLFDSFMAAYEDMERTRASTNPTFEAFVNYCDSHPEPEAPSYRIVTDYISGMTDSFADKSYQDIYWI